MTSADRTMRSTPRGQGSPVVPSSTCDCVPGSLIDERPWDAYDLDSLIPLKEVVKESAEFGFLLRHYWIPATELRFRQSSRVTTPDGSEDRRELQIDRQMVRCRSNECTWREKVRDVAVINVNGTSEESALLSEMLCSYDCYEQTYISAKPILFELPADDQKLVAQRQALYRLPMLCPPGPVPIGFTWYGKVGDDYMNFRLEAEQRVGETSVLIIQREGRYTTWLPAEATDSSNGQATTPVVTQRQGVTLFAWDRGVVLEDRFMDKIVEAGKPLAARLGTISQEVTRLVRSCPNE